MLTMATKLMTGTTSVAMLRIVTPDWSLGLPDRGSWLLWVVVGPALAQVVFVVPQMHEHAFQTAAGCAWCTAGDGV